MAVTKVQSVLGPGNGGASTATATFSVATTAGNTVVVAVIELQAGSAPPAVTTCTDNASGGSGTWAVASGLISHSGTQSYLAAQFCYILSTKSFTTVTVGWGGAGIPCQILAYELTPGVLLGTQTGSSASATAPDTGNFTPSVNGAFIIGCGAIDDNHGNTTWCTAGTNFTLDGQDGTTGGGLNSSWAYESWAQSSATTADANYTSNTPAQTGPTVASLIAIGPSGIPSVLGCMGCGT
jgi:hypothetical protein